MGMTIAVTRNVSPRTRGFLSSVMLEVAAGVYSSPRLNPAVRDRIWSVLTEWFQYENDASIILVYEDKACTDGQCIRLLGVPPINLIEIDGLTVSHRT